MMVRRRSKVTNAHVGFTLIELLVVLSIITLLVAILFPVLAHARAKAHSTTCSSNLRSMGMAVAQYTADHDDQYPIAKDASVGTYDPLFGISVQKKALLKTSPVLRDSLSIYLGGAKSEIWRCALDTGWKNPLPFENGTGESAAITLLPSAWEVLGTSYMYRATIAVSAAHYPARCRVGNKPDQLWGSEKTMVLADMQAFHGPQGSASEFDRKYNILFADGHVHIEPEGTFVASLVCTPE